MSASCSDKGKRREIDGDKICFPHYFSPPFFHWCLRQIKLCKGEKIIKFPSRPFPPDKSKSSHLFIIFPVFHPEHREDEKDIHRENRRLKQTLYLFFSNSTLYTILWTTFDLSLHHWFDVPRKIKKQMRCLYCERRSQKGSKGLAVFSEIDIFHCEWQPFWSAVWKEHPEKSINIEKL